MNYSTDFLNLWFASDSNFPEFGKQYSYRDKRKCESQLNDLILSLKEWESRDDQSSDKKTDEYLFAAMRYFFQEALGYDDDLLDVMFSKDMAQSSYQFIRSARAFDADISFHDVFQACRNVWIMNGIQFLFNQKVELTPSIFAYSMLYPYTDNYIDNSEISAAEKFEFAKRFEERLRGNTISPNTEQEVKIFKMVALIEGEWDRKTYPEVYDSLLFIHETQTKSAALITSSTSLTEEKALEICVEKGGASVIADGCLVLGKLTADQSEFLYAYGAYLQMLDDIQDVNEDVSEGLFTWHGLQAKSNNLENALNQTWNAGQQVMKMADKIGTDQVEVFKSLMSKSINLFLVEAVIANSSFFSRKFSKQVESYSPFRFSFIKKRGGSFLPLQDQFFANIERLALNSELQLADSISSIAP